MPPGTYHGDVVIDKPLLLIGANPRHTIIDAAGLSNGIYLDGYDNGGLSNVVVAGFTVENANYEGILIASASSVTIRGNHVVNNDRRFEPPASCPGHTGTVNATENWWGCRRGPGARGCATVSGPDVLLKPWLTHPAAPEGDRNCNDDRHDDGGGDDEHER